VNQTHPLRKIPAPSLSLGALDGFVVLELNEHPHPSLLGQVGCVRGEQDVPPGAMLIARGRYVFGPQPHVEGQHGPPVDEERADRSVLPFSHQLESVHGYSTNFQPAGPCFLKRTRDLPRTAEQGMMITSSSTMMANRFTSPCV